MEKSARRAPLWGKLNKSGGGQLHRSLSSSFSRLIWKCSSISLTLNSKMWTRVLPVRGWQWRLSRFNSEAWKRSIVGAFRQTNRRERRILTYVIREVPLETVKNKPALLPRFDFAAHLHQVTLAHLLREDDEGAGVDAVARGLHVGAQVKLLLPVWQIPRHRSGL